MCNEVFCFPCRGLIIVRCFKSAILGLSPILSQGEVAGSSINFSKISFAFFIFLISLVRTYLSKSPQPGVCRASNLAQTDLLLGFKSAKSTSNTRRASLAVSSKDLFFTDTPRYIVSPVLQNGPTFFQKINPVISGIQVFRLVRLDVITYSFAHAIFRTPRT